MTTRRQFIRLSGGAAAWPVAARAQQREKMRLIGILLPTTADNREFQARVGAFLQALQEVGCPRRGARPATSALSAFPSNPELPFREISSSRLASVPKIEPFPEASVKKAIRQN
jgi:hypothetical protein